MINASCIGHLGRWGNSLHQYVFARHYAESIGTQLHIPHDWYGRKFFSSVNESIINQELPTVNESDLHGQDYINISGYFQATKYISQLSRTKIKEWLVPRDKVKGPKIALHKRRGDYKTNGSYATVSDLSFERALEKFGYKMEDSKIYSDDLGGDQYQDFLEIVNAEVIFRSNSTFSWFAGVLSNAKIYSPVVEDNTGWFDAEFVEGNHPRLCYLFEDLHLKE